MRIDFDGRPQDAGPRRLRGDFAAVAAQFEMTFELWDAAAPYRTLIMVASSCTASTTCCSATRNGTLQIDIPVVVSNHPDAETLVAATASSSGTSRSRRRPSRRPRPAD